LYWCAIEEAAVEGEKGRSASTFKKNTPLAMEKERGVIRAKKRTFAEVWNKVVSRGALTGRKPGIAGKAEKGYGSSAHQEEKTNIDNCSAGLGRNGVKGAKHRALPKKGSVPIVPALPILGKEESGGYSALLLVKSFVSPCEIWLKNWWARSQNQNKFT